MSAGAPEAGFGRDGWLGTAANWLRRWFDWVARVTKGYGAPIAVGIFGAAAAGLVALQRGALAQGCDAPPDLMRLEVAFAAEHFVALLGGGVCANNVAASFAYWDLALPPCYALLLCTLFLWVERWRRFTASDERVSNVVASIHRDALTLAPSAPAARDLPVEHPPLAYAARRLSESPSSVRSLGAAVAVGIGSFAALGKWLFLAFSITGISIELLSGPRRSVVWRLRFSVLAVLVGTMPLLLTAQGQDLLERGVERKH